MPALAQTRARRPKSSGHGNDRYKKSRRPSPPSAFGFRWEGFAQQARGAGCLMGCCVPCMNTRQRRKWLRGVRPPVFWAKKWASPTGVRSPWWIRTVRWARLRREGAPPKGPLRSDPGAQKLMYAALGYQSRNGACRVTQGAESRGSRAIGEREKQHGSRDASPDRRCAEQPC